MVSPFGAGGLAVRWLWALFFVLATYNPSGHSYWHWLVDGGDERWALKALIGILLVIAILTFFFASLRALQWSGLGWTALVFAVLVWVLVDHGYLRGLSAWTWVTIHLTVLASILAVGVSWSHIRNRLSGQADTRDVTLR